MRLDARDCMSPRFLACVSAIVLAVGHPGSAADAPIKRLSPDEVSAGWLQVFDGATLFGWKPNNNIEWKVADGTVYADKGDPGLLQTSCEFADFELRCDFRLEKGGNSGIFLRSLFNPGNPATDCYELNMCDTHPDFPTGSFVGLTKPEKPVLGDGAWHTYHVTATGNKIDVAFDGEKILSYTDPRPAARRRGHIGLQKNVGKAEYRNVFLRPLSTEPLFNGKDLAGWRVVPGGQSRFAVVDGVVQVKKGRGFLETEKTWKDFVLQSEIRTNGAGLNSGIFFRAMPGTAKDPSNGYEAQVHNLFKDNDRAKPVDFGTGAIYRRIPARRVVSNDFDWFQMTVVATGPQVGVWVNGEQVTDWTDTRKPHDNPRQGLRLEGGHFSLQGHDPTTDLSFRNLRAAELPQQ